MSGVGQLSEMVAATFAQWQQGDPTIYEQDRARARAIYGTADPHEIAQTLDAFCATHLGAYISGSVFYASSQADVSGVQLTDGRRVVVKAHLPDWPLTFLTAAYQVQHRLFARNFPCPQPLLGPMPLGQGYAVVEELVDAGSFADARDPAVRRSLAQTLARLVELTRDLQAVPGLRPGLLSRIPPGALWPQPHSPIFDFERTAAGAEWIDQQASQARVVLQNSTGEQVIGHNDWSVQNCRFAEGTIGVVYDWDSLALDLETTIVGEAARGFTMNWLVPEPPPRPGPEEARAFVEDYEAARGKRFTLAEWTALAAAATYALAYGARMEQSLHPDNRDFPTGSARALLATYGAAYLRR
jgi:hypothetical protein